MYTLRLGAVLERFETLALAIARARELNPRVAARSGASGGAVHGYTTLHTPHTEGLRGGNDPIGAQVGIVAHPGYEHLAERE